ncbi:MAG TPA: PspC domain-containing protein [Streptosporangiaceae bacterium]|nr:PspC domain-containing protein [Streptosporangiaceae bacterium]
MEPPLAGITEPDTGRRRGRTRGQERRRRRRDRHDHLRDRLMKHGPRSTEPMQRSREDRLIGGVSGALAARWGRDPMLIRLGFALAGLLTVGVPVYLIAWAILPLAGEDTTIISRARTDKAGIAQAFALGTVLIVLYLVLSALGVNWLGSVAWALIIGAVGMVLIWRNSSPAEQEIIRQEAEPLLSLTSRNRRKATLIRFAIGAVLLIAGMSILFTGHVGLATLRPLGGLVLVVAAIVIVLGPWWLRIARDLMVERQARARAEERADIAARVHDSVLQTLALIQRNADQPAQVVKLARAQERELRSWLFEGRPPGEAHDAATLAEGVRLIQKDVEERHGVPVEAITVGDCELDDELRALLAAAREATVNAAKWSGADVVSVFAEVEPEEVSIYVRDRGRGFDPATVPLDRKGLAESVQARMTRRGGTAVVRSVKDEGTEVTLRMPRTTGSQAMSRA